MSAGVLTAGLLRNFNLLAGIFKPLEGNGVLSIFQVY